MCPNPLMNEKDKDRVLRVCQALREAERPVRILRGLAWPQNVREKFFAMKARALPDVAYASFDCAPVLETLQSARRLIDDRSVVGSWLARQANAIELASRMLAVAGTSEFLVFSRRLYGTPTDLLVDEKSNTLELAKLIDKILGDLAHVELGAPEPACYLAATVAAEIKQAVETKFGEEAPEVAVVEELSANALAGARRIRIRRSACFTDKDIAQLIHHEAFIHVATALNGQAQTELPILAAGHPGTTRTQEGLAVFAEFITGSMELDRLQRLSGRVLAIQMVIDGADFLDVYRYFLDRTGNEEQSFENARRVFRGGVITGGTPFTKDIVYLDGLLRVHNFLRSAVAAGRSDCLRLLFCGKLDIEDVPALCELAQAGLCRPPKYLPPWAEDLRFLIAYLSYSRFLNNVDLSLVTAHYEQLLKDAPQVGAVKANVSHTVPES